MAPLLIGIAWSWARTATAADGAAGDTSAGIRKAVPAVRARASWPWPACAASASSGRTSRPLLDTMARSASSSRSRRVGLSVRVGELRQTGPRALSVGFAAAIVIGVGTLAAIVAFGLARRPGRLAGLAGRGPRRRRSSRGPSSAASALGARSRRRLRSSIPIRIRIAAIAPPIEVTARIVAWTRTAIATAVSWSIAERRDDRRRGQLERADEARPGRHDRRERDAASRRARPGRASARCRPPGRRRGTS